MHTIRRCRSISTLPLIPFAPKQFEALTSRQKVYMWYQKCAVTRLSSVSQTRCPPNKQRVVSLVVWWFSADCRGYRSISTLPSIPFSPMFTCDIKNVRLFDSVTRLSSVSQALCPLSHCRAAVAHWWWPLSGQYLCRSHSAL